MYKEFINVFLTEVNYMGMPFKDLVVEPLKHGVFALTATFKDGTNATLNRRANVFDGDAFVERKELASNLLAIKPRTQRARLEAAPTPDPVPTEPVEDEPTADIQDDVEDESPSYNEMRSTLAGLGVKPKSQSKEDVEAAYKAI